MQQALRASSWAVAQAHRQTPSALLAQGRACQHRQAPDAAQRSSRLGFCAGGATVSAEGPTLAFADAGGMAAEPAPGLPRLLVFGGNGFVGSRVCEEALKTGLEVVSINRSGPPRHRVPWMDQVSWLQADVFDVSAWSRQLDGAVGVISCLGGFGSNEAMYKICGDASVTVFREAADAGVARAAFISVHDYKPPAAVLPGYFQGKKRAEDALAAAFPTSGVVLRPGFIQGTRYVAGVGIPLQLVGVPLDRVLGLFPTKSLANTPLLGPFFVPPVSVQAVAKAAVAAATDPAVPSGVMDVWDIKQYEAGA
ncbi:hypothetical protein WJX81_004543 [Elliptochloris bilobata]|uniref:NAD(P)-binding domain-containing protein n=1 Tax=Elliptochloris bilobata TaxID=381761 RepID=A0AAW1R2P7_9CHLO